MMTYEVFELLDISRFFQTRSDGCAKKGKSQEMKVWMEASRCAEDAARRVAAGDIEWPKVVDRLERQALECALTWMLAPDQISDREAEKLLEDLDFAVNGLIEARNKTELKCPSSGPVPVSEI